MTTTNAREPSLPPATDATPTTDATTPSSPPPAAAHPPAMPVTAPTGSTTAPAASSGSRLASGGSRLASGASPASTPASLPLEPASARPERLLSLDLFRGLVILSMLIVNNIEDPGVVGYFWKHVNWVSGSQAAAWAGWWAARPDSFASAAAWLTDLPLFRHCTLADFVMPWFMLIIGLSIPYSVKSANARGQSWLVTWRKVIVRSAMLVVLGWAIQNSLAVMSWVGTDPRPAMPSFRLGMDVLQLLGVAYLVTRVLYLLPYAAHLPAAAMLFIAHWALLRFYPQPLDSDGLGGTGSFTASHNAVSHIYATWWVFKSFNLAPHLSISAAGMLSVVPAAGTMLLGGVIGRLLASERSHIAKIRWLGIGGAALAVAGFVWAFDLTFNKPRWSPSYLVYTSGVGMLLLAALYWAADVRRWRAAWWTVPLVALGANSIAAYWVPIMVKIWALNIPRATNDSGKTVSFKAVLVEDLQQGLGRWGGTWAFTLAWLAVWWVVFYIAYRKRWFWKL